MHNKLEFIPQLVGNKKKCGICNHTEVLYLCKYKDKLKKYLCSGCYYTAPYKSVFSLKKGV